jgi:hypothetical protein
MGIGASLFMLNEPPSLHYLITETYSLLVGFYVAEIISYHVSLLDLACDKGGLAIKSLRSCFWLIAVSKLDSSLI